MKKLLTILFLFSLILNSISQDSVYVYQQGGMIRIDNLYADSQFLTSGEISIRLRGSDIYLKDQISKRDYNIGTYSEIFNRDTLGYSDQQAVLQYLNSIINRRLSSVEIQDQTTEIIGLFMAQILDELTVVYNTTKDIDTLTIETTGTTPVVGNFICLQEQSKITQVEILVVTPIAGNQYRLQIAVPLDYAYTTAGGCSLQNCDMDVNGAVTSLDFQIGPRGNYSWDVTRITVIMVLSTAGDDGLFGNIAALTNGVYFRKEDAASSQNLFNIKDNSDFRIEGYDVIYPARSGGGGSFGLGARITFAGQDKRGVVIRLDGRLSESLKLNIRDDLTGIAKFRVKAQGHIVED